VRKVRDVFMGHPVYSVILFLAKKCKKAVFASYNLTSDDILPLVENRLFEEISLHPDKF